MDLVHSATSVVELSWLWTHCSSHALASIFIRYYKERLFSEIFKPGCISDMLVTLLVFFQMEKKV